MAVSLKSAREIALMRAAGRINALTLAEMAAAIKPGVTTASLNKIAERVIAQHKGLPAFKGVPGPVPYPYATTISVNEELVHGMPGRRVLHEGDLVKLDCGVRFEGYVADSAITVGVGVLSDQARWLLEVTESALARGIAQARAGQRLGDIAAAIQGYVEGGHGLSLAREYEGHGVGRELHEPPDVPNRGRAGTGLVLRPGLTLAIEPMVIIGDPALEEGRDGWTVRTVSGGWTAHFEHTVAITDGEPEILTVA
ncbi:MAG: type I methionyl aminopeptidase [Anaerolineales bacterium]|nr:type I methionyl aminopeptidase [Anaerolineales bacterium]